MSMSRFAPAGMALVMPVGDPATLSDTLLG
jgi:hypothetical protein